MNHAEGLSEPGNLVDPDLVVPLARQTITVEEFAELAGIGRTTAYEAARRGEIPARRIGRRYVLPMPLVRQWFGEVEPSTDLAPVLGLPQSVEAAIAEPEASD
jgi:excisionase family DNA binding protein